jgi:succinoglycan biosynthesis protein ExoA
MEDWPSVSVVIPVRNEAGSIGAALASIQLQSYPGPLEVVVADGASTDGTAEVVRDLGDPAIRVVDNPNGTTPAGLNAAIAASIGDVVVRCDAHSELPAGYIERAIRTLVETGADNVGGIQAAEGIAPLQRAIGYAMTSKVGVGDAAFHYGGEAGPTDTVYLGVFRRAALERVGGFDETLARNQDYELNVRIRDTGGTVWFDPGLSVTYRPRDSLGALGRQFWDYGRWKRKVLAKHPGSLRWRQTVPPAFVVGLVGSVVLLAARNPLGWVVPGAYAALTGAVAVTEAARRRDAAAVLMPAALATMHASWGAGFLRGAPRDRSKTGTTT